MRTLSKPSTAKCSLEHYTAFLLAEPHSAGCVRLAEVAGGEFAHAAANRFLNCEEFSGRDLFEEARPLLDLEGGTLSVDDTVLDKPYSQENKTELVGYFWSGKHGRAVKGLCLVTLLYTDPKGVRLPVNFRLVDKAEGKTKNERPLPFPCACAGRAPNMRAGFWPKRRRRCPRHDHRTWVSVSCTELALPSDDCRQLQVVGRRGRTGRTAWLLPGCTACRNDIRFTWSHFPTPPGLALGGFLFSAAGANIGDLVAGNGHPGPFDGFHVREARQRGAAVKRTGRNPALTSRLYAVFG
jgi:hypothetical protein